MATSRIKVIDPKKEEVRHTQRDNWEVMKPFVHFAFNALNVICATLVAIVMALPLLKSKHNDETAIKRR